MCVLSHEDISEEVKQGNLIIAPFSESLLRPNSYDWTLGPAILRADPAKLNTWIPEKHLNIGEEFIFRAGEFYLCTTLQRFILPNYMMAMMDGRSSFGRLGVIEHFTAGHVDAEFAGHLTGEVMALGPWDVPVKIGQNIGQIIFQYLRTPATKGYKDFAGSKYMNQSLPTPSRLYQEGKNGEPPVK